MHKIGVGVGILLICSISVVAQDKKGFLGLTSNKYPACLAIEYEELADDHPLKQWAARVTRRIWDEEAPTFPIFVRKGVSEACLNAVYAAQPPKDDPAWIVWYLEFSIVSDPIHAGWHPLVGVTHIMMGDELLKLASPEEIRFGVAHEICHGARAVTSSFFNTRFEFEFAVNEVVLGSGLGIERQHVLQMYHTGKKILQNHSESENTSPALRSQLKYAIALLEQQILFHKSKWGIE